MKRTSLIVGIILLIISIYYLFNLIYYLSDNYKITDYGYGVLVGKILLLILGIIFTFIGIRKKTQTH